MGWLFVLVFALVIEWAVISRIMDNQLAGAVISAVLGYGAAIFTWSSITGGTLGAGVAACFWGFMVALVIQLVLAYRGMNRRRDAIEDTFE